MIAHYMTDDHRKCDENFGQIEILVEQNNFDEAKKEFSKWKMGMENHLRKEEGYLFSQVEAKLGGKIGPIIVMEMEHQQMRDLFERMDRSIDEKDVNTYLGLSESCMILIQQHNMKEEQMLYPLIDRALSEEANEVMDKLQNGTFS